MREPGQLPVTKSQVPVHSAPTRHVIRVIRIRNRDALSTPELGLDEIEPGCLGRHADAHADGVDVKHAGWLQLAQAQRDRSLRARAQGGRNRRYV